MEKYKVVDLFAGAGGLSLGFEQTNKFEIKVAFENSPYMQETYRANHPNVDVQGDVCVADYAQIQRDHGEIDVVIGGPPCQGFSNANCQKNHVISQNNKLVKQYVRAILELKPKAFVMENVSMLRSNVHRFFLEAGDDELVKKYGIPVTKTQVVLLDKDHLFPGAADVVKSKKTIDHYLWDEKDYHILNVIYKTSKNIEKLGATLEKYRAQLIALCDKFFVSDYDGEHYIIQQNCRAFLALRKYYNGELNVDAIKCEIENAIMIQRMVSRANEIFENNITVDDYTEENGLIATIRSFAVHDYIQAILGSEEFGYVMTSDVLCAADFGAPQKRMRFVLMGVKRSISETIALPKGRFKDGEYRTVRDAIEDIEDVPPVFSLADDVGIQVDEVATGELGTLLRDSQTLRNHITTSTTATAMERFKALKQGENFHSLDDSLKTTYTDASRTQNTIYLRLSYDEPSGTVVNVRKSMWVHPTLDRAISVREAARLQTFPYSFVFCGTKDKQYQQVGNAVPPIMAKAIAKKIAKLLKKQQNAGDDNNGY